MPLFGLVKVQPKNWLHTLFGSGGPTVAVAYTKVLPSSEELTPPELSELVDTRTPQIATDVGKEVEDIFEVRPLVYCEHGIGARQG